ncbi:MAG TPA: glycosyltransferase family 4 protein [Thermoanaerobaculia bacterium]|jgi:glycosyltransferase involved in cell wall biosynthesis|nr:glycosyltransferase family 4 protein [Thermoanaerobaculia bacterium]
MKILHYSPAFPPSVGGLETTVVDLSTGLSALGCEVTVVTATRSAEPDRFPFSVVRRPSRRALLALVRGHEVFLQANVSLRGLWPLLFVRRPWVVSHHSWYSRTDGHIAWQDRLKRRLLRYAAASVAVSRAVADDLHPVRSIVIGNPYREDVFRLYPEIARTRDLVAVGRLVSDKGFDVLLEALAILERKEGLKPRLTLIGDGPERPRLAAQAASLGLSERIEMTGALPHQEIALRLAEHRFLVAPSRYQEPFGLVALEGIACGCAVIGSSGGGLPEAIGPCGRTFANGDAAALAGVLAELLVTPGIREQLLERAAEHLSQHTRDRVARRYLAVLTDAVNSSRRRSGEVEQ